MPEPRLLVLTPDFPPEPGGIQTVAHRLASALTAFEVRVVTTTAPGAEGFDASIAPEVVRAGSQRLGHRANVLALNARGLAEGLRFRPDVVLSVHVVCAPAAAFLRRHAGAPTVLYLHADEVTTAGAVAGFAMRRADRIVAVSEYTRRLAIAGGADPSRIDRVAPGVDLPGPHPRSRRERPTVLTVAAMLERYKGHDVLIRALPLIRAQVPEVEWVVVGSGRLRTVYEALVRDVGLEAAVRFCGRLGDAERDAWFDAADVFAMPSRLRLGGEGGEGFGLVYLEAAARGLPVVAGAVAGAADAVVDGETGLLVNPEDPVAVGAAITDLLRDRERAERMGDAGRAWAARHAWPAVTARVQDLLLDAAGR